MEKNFIEYCELSLKFGMKFAPFSSIFHSMNKSEQNSADILHFFRVILTIVTIHLSDFYIIQWDFMKFNDISQNYQNVMKFLGIILCFHSVLMYFVDFLFLFQCFWKLSTKFQFQILLSFGQIQNFKISDLIIAKVKKVNIAVTYSVTNFMLMLITYSPSTIL